MMIPGRQTGFTLVELVMVLVVSGILAAGVISYIGRSVEGLTDTANRNQLATVGRIAINRLAMEMHNALPNSIRATTAGGGGDQCIEFIPVRAATTYINPSFGGGGTVSFEVVDFNPSQHGVSGGFAVIYPNRPDLFYDGDEGGTGGTYANWPTFPNRRPIQEIVDIQNSTSADQSTVTLVQAHRFRRRSPNQRFFVVEQPVSFCVSGSKLYRYTDYGFFTNQTSTEESGSCVVTTPARCLPNYAALGASPPRIKTLVIDSIDNTGITAFTVGVQTLDRNALVSIDLNLSANGESVRLRHEILTRSVP